MSGRSALSQRMWLGLVLVVLPTLALLAIAFYQVVTIVPELQQSQILVTNSLDVLTTTLELDRAIQDAERG